ncbi:2Fe-2S iron-sulfur cluster-binding protein [Streptomyces capillispiralis]|uniref:2Fe-2S iron-sulfur cluster-binding protein n=1 Tax=Streptomyces capillispiralis TaxID=68182 RepID=UPI0036C2D0F8
MNTVTAPSAPFGGVPAGPPRRTGWYPLEVTEVRQLGAGTVAVTLDVPAALRDVFTHHPGRHVTVRYREAGAELRRSYSVCPPPHAPGMLRLVIKRLGPGGFGDFAVTRLAAGDRLELSPPTGDFALPELPGGHHVLLAGGTGITPLAPMAARVLRRDPACRVSLVHSVRTSADAVLADELGELKDEFVDRFTVLYVLTGQERGSGGGVLGQRLDAGGLRRLLAAVDARPGPDTAFALCGPPGLVGTARRVLAESGADPSLVRWELFTAGAAPVRSPEPAGPVSQVGQARVTAVLDGRRRTAAVLPQDPSLLDALLRADPDVPYACREGVCGSCRARVVSGQVTADRQFALDEGERAAGFTLVCRARPRTAEVVVDFDA